MSLNIEDQLRAHLHAEASRAPGSERLVREMSVRAKRQGVRRGAVGIVLAATVAAFAAGLATSAPSRVDTDRLRADGTTAQDPRGSVDDSSNSYCAISYMPDRLKRMDFALAGVVSDIEPPRRDQSLYIVTFNVADWYSGGNGEERVQVAMPNPQPESESEELPDPFERGTVLLVSGQEAGGVKEAWGCGFTRYFDSETADVWRQQLGQG